MSVGFRDHNWISERRFLKLTICKTFVYETDDVYNEQEKKTGISTRFKVEFLVIFTEEEGYDSGSIREVWTSQNRIGHGYLHFS